MSRTYTKEELKKILDKHAKWCRGEADGIRANLRSANLYGADLRGADLRSANLYGADLRGAYLRSANLYGAYLRSANLYGANLRSADLRSADLRSAYLRSANLRSANLYGADLRSANLYGADLRSADLRSADLRSANLYGADLRSADLYGADLRSADLYGADLRSAKGIEDYVDHWIIPEEGKFTGWKAVRSLKDCRPIVLKLLIPSKADRSCCYQSRKIRVARAKAVAAFEVNGDECPEKEFRSDYSESFHWRIGKLHKVNDFKADPSFECGSGLHLFITRKEAARYLR